MGKMCEQGHSSLLIYIVSMAISVTSAFNIDTENPQIFAGEENHFFGYKVLQFISGQEKGVMVSAPLQLNGSGGICRCVQNRTDCFTPQETVIAKHFGLSIAKESTHHKFTACSPSLAHECYQNSYLNSRCYQFDSQFQNFSIFTPAFQECTKKTVNLAFLFDGSESMTTDDFNKNKVFIQDIMNSLKNSSIKFAAVQFSTNPRTVFTFTEYQEGRASEYLDKEKHMKDLTNTHKALKYVLKNIFDNPDAGASPDATKVLVIITDGNPSDKDRNIIQKCDEKNIIRFVIGVKVKEDTLIKLRAIASEPKINNTFHIDDYNGLKGILENFQKKIFNIEGSLGSNTALAGNLVDEMSQSGFSVIYHKNVLILGAVGSNSWRGSLYERQDSNSEERQILDPNLEESSYMGYSVATGEKNNEPLYFTGAPRFNHTGQVLLFTKQSNIWTVKQRVNGQQIGSYFGAELCTVDIDSDSNTDFLLVGAPLFYHSQEKREGQIYIYRVTHEMGLKSEMTVHVPSRGRFGTAISSLTDVNGDGLRDVAVGAPLENNHRGAVYIYLGDKLRGIRNTYSQRIMAETIKSHLQFFGQAIDGKIDLDGDGLIDIVVGSRGNVVVLRSRPVLTVSAHLRFQPPEISTDNIDCLSNTDATLPMVTLTTCFHMAEATQSQAGAMTTGLNISYTLDVDPLRQISRGFFSKTDKGARKSESTVVLRKEETCFNHSVYMPKCVKDTLSPIVIKLHFSQSESKQEAAILNIDSPAQAVVGVPFERNCKQNDTCVAELEVDFNFTTSTLLVVHQSYFNMTVRLSNHGDDSYNTSLTLYYPPGLSFSLMDLVKTTRPTLHSCDGLEGVLDKTMCGVNLPVYRSRSTAIFKTVFRIINTYDWNETISITITGQSDNQNSTRSSMTKTIPVQFEIDLAVRVNEDTTSYLNFTPEDSAPKRLVNVYEVKNMGFKALPVYVTLSIPTKLEHNFEMKNYQVSVLQNKTQCRNIIKATSNYCSSDKHCKSIVCESFILDKYSTTKFILSAEVAFGDLKQRAKDIALPKQFTGDVAEVQFKSFIKVGYDKQRYIQASTKQENKDDPPSFLQTQTDVRIEFIIPANEKLIIGTGVGGGLLLLIIITVVMFLMGCFKRRRPQEDASGLHSEETPDQHDTYVQSDQAVTNVPESKSTDSKSDGAVEAKPLLSNGENVDSCILTKADREESDKKQDVTTPSVSESQSQSNSKSDGTAEAKLSLDNGENANSCVLANNEGVESDKKQDGTPKSRDVFNVI